jgi:hypothetical protein
VTIQDLSKFIRIRELSGRHVNLDGPGKPGPRFLRRKIERKSGDQQRAFEFHENRVIGVLRDGPRIVQLVLGRRALWVIANTTWLLVEITANDFDVVGKFCVNM